MFDFLTDGTHQAVFYWGFMLLGAFGALVAADLLRTLRHHLHNRRAGLDGELWH
jgi:hypothetical protein